MELAWMMLANHAEAPPNGLLYLSGASWDTLNVTEPLPPEAPTGAVAFVHGVLVARLLFHSTEVGTEFPFALTIIDEDGRQVGRVEGGVTARTEDDAPATWSRASNVIVGLTGLPLPRFGEYRISLAVNREHKGELPFRVVRRY